MPSRELLPALGLTRGLSYPKEMCVLQRSMWYNHSGLLLGSSDMKIGEPQQVAENLETGEMLVIVPSHEITQSDLTGLQGNQIKQQRARDMASRFAMLIVPRCIYLPGLDGGYTDHRGIFEAPTLSPRAASNMIHSVQRLADFANKRA